MNRKVRHPYHILTISGLIVGESYSFITHDKGVNHTNNLVFGGIIDDSAKIAQNNHFSLSNATSPKAFTYLTDDNIFTVHMDGWFKAGENCLGEIVIKYWYSKIGYSGYDRMRTYLGPEKKEEKLDRYEWLIVPTEYWKDDPKIYVLDWVNPDDTIKKVGLNRTPIFDDWEKRAKEKQNKIWEYVCR